MLQRLSGSVRPSLLIIALGAVFSFIIIYEFVTAESYRRPLIAGFIMALALIAWLVYSFFQSTEISWNKQGITIKENKKKLPFIPWHSVNTLVKLPYQPYFALLDYKGMTLAKVHSRWTQIDDFKEAVQHHLANNRQTEKTRDFYVPEDKTSAHIGFLSGISAYLIIRYIFNRPDIVELGLILSLITVVFLYEVFRIRSLHLKQDKIELRYLFYRRHIPYALIENTRLSLNPHKPVTGHISQLHISQKGRRKNYLIRAFNEQTDNISVQLDRQMAG